MLGLVLGLRLGLGLRLRLRPGQGLGKGSGTVSVVSTLKPSRSASRVGRAFTCISRAYGLVPCDTAVRFSSAAASSGQKRLSPTRQYTPGAFAAEQASRSVPTTSACWAKPTRSNEHRRLCQNAAKPALVTAMITVPEACTRDCSAGLKQSMREHTVPVPASGRVEPSRPTSSCMGRTVAMKLPIVDGLTTLERTTRAPREFARVRR